MSARDSGLLLGIIFAIVGLGKLTLLSSAFPPLRYAHVELPMSVNAFVPLAVDIFLHHGFGGFYLTIATATELAGLIWFLSGIERRIDSINAMPFTAMPIVYFSVFSILRILLLCSAGYLIFHLLSSTVQQRLLLQKAPHLQEFAARIRWPHFCYAILLSTELCIASFTELDLTLALLPAYAMLGILLLVPYKRYGSLYAAIGLLLTTCMVDFVYAVMLLRSDDELVWRILVPILQFLRIAAACWAVTVIARQLN